MLTEILQTLTFLSLGSLLASVMFYFSSDSRKSKETHKIISIGSLVTLIAGTIGLAFL